ncbi:MAG: TM2 domain-containing protein [Oscillospiraceae bacterium]
MFEGECLKGEIDMSGQGAFESDADFKNRMIYEKTGLSRGLFESDADYHNRAIRESSGIKQGWFENDDEYKNRVTREKSGVRQGIFESDDEYENRVIREKSGINQGLFESNREYKGRVISASGSTSPEFSVGLLLVCALCAILIALIEPLVIIYSIIKLIIYISKGGSGKNKYVAMLLWGIVGFLSAHNFYTGNKKRAVGQLILLAANVALTAYIIGDVKPMLFSIISAVMMISWLVSLTKDLVVLVLGPEKL